jgi:type VI secretion system secreted protein VgrG
MGMPANKTQSAIRDHAGNEILMEGKGGSEDIRITAVKDMNVTVTNDYNDIVKSGNRTIAINSGTHTETIKGDTQITVTTGALTVSVSNNTATFISKSTMNVDSSDADVHIVAKTKIALDVGSSHLLMEENGSISLIGKNIAIHGSESVSISSAAIRSIADQEHEIKGAITVSEGVTTNTVKGGMVMLNPGT